MTIFTSKKTENKQIYKNVAAIFFALLVWQIAASAFDSKIIFATPLASLKRLYEIIIDARVFSLLGFTLVRVISGFLAAFAVGTLLGVFAAKFKIIETILFPYMLTVKSVPVASFVIIALFLFSSGGLSLFVSFLIVLPVIYTNVLTGLKNTDVKMLELSNVYKLNFTRKLLYVYFPAVKNYILSGGKISIGLAWKSGVAAEIIGVPSGSLGEALYYAKVHLDSETLFAVTIIIILASVACEKLFTIIAKSVFGAIERL